MKALLWLSGAATIFCIGGFVGAITVDQQKLCAPLVCEQGKGQRWLDGHCYEAATLREVRP